MTLRRGRWVLLALGLCAGLAILETAARALDWRSQWWGSFCRYDETLGWALVPGRQGRFWSSEFSVRVAVSSQGLRDREYPYPRREGVARALVLGDSFVWCWGVEIEQCFTEIVEDRLAPTEIIAAGVPGYGTTQELLYYEREGRRFRPDVVLLVFVANDPWDNLAEEVRPRWRLVGSELVPGRGPVPRRLGPVASFLREHSHLCAVVDYRIETRRRRRAAPEVPARTGEALALTDALLDRLAARAQADGARLALALERLPRETAGHLLDYCRRRGLPCLDLEPHLAAAEARGVAVQLGRDVHRSAAGQLVVADAITEFLRPIVLQ